MGLEDTAIVQTQSLQKKVLKSPAKGKYLLRLVKDPNEPYYTAVKAFNH